MTLIGFHRKHLAARHLEILNTNTGISSKSMGSIQNNLKDYQYET